MTPKGRARVNLRIQGHDTPVDFLVVVGLREEVILGVEWLTSQRAVIDLYRGCLHFGRNERATVHLLPQKRGKTDVDVVLPQVSKELSREQGNELSKVLGEFKEIFAPYAGPAPLQAYKIQLTDSKPIKLPSYRLSDVKKKNLYAQLEGMLSDGVIEASRSKYSFPIVMVSKKGKEEYRFCVDYRRLNDVTEDEMSQLPIIQETLKDLGGAKIFSTIDLQKGYWQIPVEEASRKYTAFTTPDGASYQFRVLPFGLKGAPAHFQKTMCQEVLAGYLRDFCMVYLDDIIVYSSDWKTHMYHLRLVFERLQQFSLRCAADKCKLASERLDYLGHVVTNGGNHPQVVHGLSIRDTPVPKSRRQLRAFLGLAGWVREYIEKFAEIAAPLTDLLSTKRPFRWNEQADDAMKRLKDELSKPL
jgi:hypothetical protein